MPQFRIYLTDVERKILEHTVANPSDWIDNLVEWRVRIAEDEYLPTAIAQIKASGATSIPGTRDEIILAANMPAKDPNWTPLERDIPDDDLVAEYVFDLEEDDLKMLAFMWENPHTHIRDLVVDRCRLALEEKAALITKELLADPTWTDPIPTDPVALLDLVELKSCAQHLEDSGKAIREMMEKSLNGETDAYVPPEVPFMSYKHHGPPAP